MTKSEQEPLVQECRNSGMIVRAWCREHGISYSTYMGWSKNFPVEHAKQVKHTQGTSQQWMALETVITAPAKDSPAGKKPDHISLNFGKWSIIPFPDKGWNTIRPTYPNRCGLCSNY